MKPEDAAEQYAESVKPSRYGGYFDTRYSEDAFLAGHAHAVAEYQSIWRKPEERPGVNSESVICARSDIGLVEFLASDNDHITQMMQTAYAWCYASDLLKTLPSFATEEK